MKKKNWKSYCDIGCMRCFKCGGTMSCIYFLGFIGAAVYYFQAGEGFVGFLKALVWPAFLVYKLLGM